MVACEMCGKDVPTLNNAVVAGTQMKVCSSCLRHGNSIEEKVEPSKTFYKKKKAQAIELAVVDNYASMINSELSKRSMNVQQLARAINIKESSLNKYLSNKIKIDVLTAKKIEKYLELSLTKEVESVNVQDYMDEESQEEASSLGDLLMKQLKEKNNK